MAAKSRIVFVGCVEEGKACLGEILDAGGNVIAILTFTDELAQKTSGAVRFEDLAEAHNISLHKVRSTNTPEAVSLLRQMQPDVIFVIGWTRLVSSDVLAIPKLGCIGMHASRLPKYRGRAPVNWAIINNEEISANTMLLLDEGVDTGDILLQKVFPISLADTCKTVYEKVATAGREMIREIMPFLDSGQLPRKPQQHDQATIMPKRTPEDGRIDWNKSAFELFNWIRALTHPYPGAFAFLKEKKIIVWQAHPAHFSDNIERAGAGAKLRPGEVVSVSDGITVSTGCDELLTLRRMNYVGENEISWHEFLSHSQLSVGDILG